MGDDYINLESGKKADRPGLPAGRQFPGRAPGFPEIGTTNGIAKCSTIFGAVSARGTHPTPAKASPKAQECMARRRKSLE